MSSEMCIRDSHEADTVVMAGMGGETIIHILTDSSWPRDSGCTLLLQPQTKVCLLYTSGCS